MDAQALRQGHLCSEVGAAAKAIDSEGAAGRNRRADQRPVADDAGAEQRGNVLVVDACGKCIGERLVDKAEVCITAITVPAGKSWRDAQVFRAAAAESPSANRVALSPSASTTPTTS